MGIVMGGGKAVSITSTDVDSPNGVGRIPRGYDSNNTMGGFKAGESLVYHPDYYDPSRFSALLISAASFVAPELAFTAAIRIGGGFARVIGPAGPLFGSAQLKGSETFII